MSARRPLEVHLVGWLPPPYGGISVHVSRLRRRLIEAGHRCTVWCESPRPGQNERLLERPARALRDLAGIGRDAVIHYHNSHFLAGVLSCLHNRTVFTTHNERPGESLTGGRFPVQWLFRRVARRRFRRVPHHIAVSERAKALLVQLGVRPESVSVINAYLPPTGDEEAHPASAAAFAEFRARFRWVLTANASIVKFHAGEDLYGADLCLELLAELVASHPDAGLALAISHGGGSAYVTALQARARELGVAERILWMFEPGAYHPLLRHCDLFLRPTNTDGFSVSVAEAFEFGVPVVASDAVPRPCGCALFRNRDAADFLRAVRAVLDDLPAWRAKSQAAREPDHFPRILELYERVCA
ncbi:MAG: glycosyltransferase family 4 protein [Planctomycetota bacterium]